MFTFLHAFANYLFAAPIRKRIDIIAFLAASMIPDLEGLYYMPAAYAACGADSACAAAYPSHYAIHSIFGTIFIVAVLASVCSLIWKKWRKEKKFDMRAVYLSAVFGGLLHIIADLFFHTGTDALYLLWPLPQQFSLASAEAQTVWTALSVIGVVALIYLERKNITGLFHGQKKA